MSAPDRTPYRTSLTVMSNAAPPPDSSMPAYAAAGGTIDGRSR